MSSKGADSLVKLTFTKPNKFAVFAVIEFLPALSLTVFYCLSNLRNIYAWILSNLMTDCNCLRMFSIDLRPVNKYIVLLIIWLKHLYLGSFSCQICMTEQDISPNLA